MMRNNLKKKRYAHRLVIFLLLLALFLAACNPTLPITPEPSTPTQPQPRASATPQPTPTAAPPVINVCTAEDPGSLFPYDGNDTASRRTILRILNDGRFENIMTGNGSGLLTAYPQFGNMISQVPVPVSAGVVIMDAYGEVTVLQSGKLVRPSQCRAMDCLISWDGSSELTMDQTVVNFKLNPDEKWSDGSPLNSADYLFSFQVMQQMGQPVDQKRLEVTQSLTAKDDYTVEWKGLPGFGGIGLEQYLPLPMPTHQLDDEKIDKLELSPFFHDEFLSWGAYRVKTWQRDVGLVLEPNPNYYRRDEGLPEIKDLNIHFVPDQDEALRRLQSGECDALDASYDFLSMKTADWQPYLAASNFHLDYDNQAVEMVFGIRPAAYDVDYRGAIATRPDWFGDNRTREAFSLAITQAQLNQSIYAPHLPETVSVSPAGIFGPGAKLENLLDEAGWKLVDGTRIAEGVAGVIDGTAFRITLLTSQSQADQELAALITHTLANLGIEVTAQALPLDQLYMPGPEGPLFGRKFDLALVSWQSDPVSNCATYMSKSIPSNANHWIGTNLAGLQDEDFDRACAWNLVSFEPVSTSNSGERCAGICKIFLEQSPSVKAIDRVRLWVSNKTLQMESDWTLEQIEFVSKLGSN